MNPGSLDTPVEFYGITIVDDGMGGTSETRAVVSGSPKWGRLDPLKGMTRVEAGKVATTLQNKLTIRRWADLDPAYEIEIGSEVYLIDSIEDYRRGGFQALWIKRKV